MQEASLSTSDLMKMFDIGRNTLRLYEEVGILQNIQRTESGYREYSKTHAERLQFTLRAKNAGFTLNEIKDLLEMLDAQKNLTCGTVSKEISNKMSEVENQINSLTLKKAFLGNFLEACQANGNDKTCDVVSVGFSQKACCSI